MRTVLGALAILGIAANAHAQSRPFPQEVEYSAGIKPSHLTSADAVASYELIKSSNLKSDCGNGYLRLEFKNPLGTTVSEGMGYGMVLAAYHGDQATFDGLWSFVQKNFNEDQLMGWKVTCGGFDLTGETYGDVAATDGELDIAFGLIVAGEQWGEPYQQAGIDYVGRIKQTLFEKCNATGRWVQRAGNGFGGCDFSNTSYWMPGYYRVFAEVTGDTFWNEAVTDTYAIMAINQNATTGFLSNETDQYGTVPAGQAVVNYNGARIPWRIAADYLWYGAPEAKAYLDKLLTWGEAQDPTNLLDGFNVNGQMIGTWNQAAPFSGAWACGAMARSQQSLDTFTDFFKTCDFDGYYHDELRALYDLMLTGNFWKPGSEVTSMGGSDSDGEGGAAGTSVNSTGGVGGAGSNPSAGGASAGANAASGGTTASVNESLAVPASDEGCGCAVPGKRPEFGGAWWLVAGALSWGLRRRKSRAERFLERSQLTQRLPGTDSTDAP